MRITSKEQVYSLKKYDTFSIGGMLYRIEKIDEETGNYQTSTYKDFPLGDFDTSYLFNMSPEYICDKLKL